MFSGEESSEALCVDSRLRSLALGVSDELNALTREKTWLILHLSTCTTQLETVCATPADVMGRLYT